MILDFSFIASMIILEIVSIIFENKWYIWHIEYDYGIYKLENKSNNFPSGYHYFNKISPRGPKYKDKTEKVNHTIFISIVNSSRVKQKLLAATIASSHQSFVPFSTFNFEKFERQVERIAQWITCLFYI